MKLLHTSPRSELYDIGSGKVLKLYSGWIPDASVEGEFHVTNLVRNAGLPAPKAHEIVTLKHRRGIVFDRIDGVDLREALVHRPWMLQQAGRAMAQLHAQVHACVDLPDLRDQEQYLDRCIQASDKLLKPYSNKIAEYRERLAGGPKCLCHGDFSVDNIRRLPSGQWMLLDWCDACFGYPLSDVARAWLLIHSPAHRAGFPVADKILSKVAKYFLSRYYCNAYFTLQPADKKALEAWIVPMAAARLCEKIPGEKEWLLNLIKTR